MGKDHQLQLVCALPLYHIFALTVCCLLGMRTGGFNILIPNPRDLPSVVKALQGHQVNMFPAVNTLYNALAQNEDFKKLDFSGALGEPFSLPHEWRIVPPIIAMSGIFTFAWTASVLVNFVARYNDLRADIMARRRQASDGTRPP